MGQQTPTSENCNEIDDDCDGQIDEGLSGGFCDTGSEGICAFGSYVCAEGYYSCSPLNEPSSEVQCNGQDDDCDGATDECFVAGTPIAMADGTRRAIEQIRVGDWVLAYDIEAEVVTPAPVIRTFVHAQNTGDRAILLVNDTLRVTSNHPFYVNGNWVPAGDLGVSDGLLMLDATVKDGLLKVQAGVVNSLYSEVVREATFNLTVGTHHNYFAGGILVHNKEMCP
ncbi:Hint domain-containing protein [Chondromyces apiculatus]|nr:Hint domain-containing protein [Chondromyces apiculatus]